MPFSLAGPFVELPRYHPLLNILRCRYFMATALTPAPSLPLVAKIGDFRIYESKDALPVAFLVDKWQVANGRNEIFKAMKESSFKPAEEVILEDIPVPAPVPSAKGGAPGEVKVEACYPGRITLSARLDRPAILVVTEKYDPGWRAKGTGASLPAEQKYRIMPADYILMAIPLPAGEHGFVIEYIPVGFGAGLAVSGIAAVVFITAAAVAYRRRKTQ
jgi:hypothetical protein